MPLIIKMLILINVNVLDISFDLMQVDIFLSVGSGFGENVIVFNADMSSLLHIDDKKMSWFLGKAQQMIYMILLWL